jgi:hypothetical protein
VFHKILIPVKERKTCSTDAQDEYDAGKKAPEPVVQPGVVEADELYRLPCQKDREQ